MRTGFGFGGAPFFRKSELTEEFEVGLCQIGVVGNNMDGKYRILFLMCLVKK